LKITYGHSIWQLFFDNFLLIFSAPLAFYAVNFQAFGEAILDGLEIPSFMILNECLPLPASTPSPKLVIY